MLDIEGLYWIFFNNVSLGSVPLIVVVIPLSSEVVTMVIPLAMVVSSHWCSIAVNIHRDRGIIHPSQGIRRIVLRRVLALWAWVIPLWMLLLRSKGSKVSISSEYISKQHFRPYTGKGFFGILLVSDWCRVAHYIFSHIVW